MLLLANKMMMMMMNYFLLHFHWSCFTHKNLEVQKLEIFSFSEVFL